MKFSRVTVSPERHDDNLTNKIREIWFPWWLPSGRWGNKIGISHKIGEIWHH